jgi:hypothetical protein
VDQQWDEYERSLIARVEQCTPMPCWNDLNQPRLAEIASREGIDFATTLLYCCLRQSPVHGPAIAALDGLTVSESSSRPGEWRPFVAIVPGGCHEESADSRDALQMVHAEMARLGLPAEIVPVRSFGLLPEQASLVAAWLETRREAEMIVVSLSKGSAEVKLALKRYPGAFRRVCAWVNISGLVYGSEWIRWLLDRTVSRWSARAWCWYWRYPFAALEHTAGFRPQHAGPHADDSHHRVAAGTSPLPSVHAPKLLSAHAAGPERWHGDHGGRCRPISGIDLSGLERRSLPACARIERTDIRRPGAAVPGRSPFPRVR